MSENPFQFFINLVEYDQETRNLHAQIDKLKQEVAQLRAQELKLHEQKQEGEGAVKALRKAIEEKELDIKTYDEQQKKKRKHLEEVAGNYKEYQALKREIEQLGVQQIETEEALIALWNKFETAEKEFEGQKKSIEEQLATNAKELQEKQDMSNQVQVALKKRSGDRADLVAQVPEEWLEKYELMSMQVSDPVVPVLNGSCSACFYAIPGPEVVRLKRRAISQCKGCFRLLFMKEAMNEVEQ